MQTKLLRDDLDRSSLKLITSSSRERQSRGDTSYQDDDVDDENVVARARGSNDDL